MKSIYKYITCLIIWFVIFVIIRRIHNGFIPDYLNISNFSEGKTSNYFSLLWEITASIFAILIAVITFGYEALGNSSRRRQRFNILNKWFVAVYASLAVTIIIFSFYSAFTVHSLKQSNHLTTAYFLGILFISFVLLLLIFTIWLLSLSDTVGSVKKLIDQSNSLEGFTDIISDELNYYIQEHDRVAFSNNILPHLNNHCLLDIGNANDRQRTSNILNSLIKVWEAGNLESIRVGEQQYFIAVWYNIENIYAHAARNSSPLLHYQTLESFIRQQIEFLAVNNYIGSLAIGAKTISRIFLNQLRNNCPPQDSISDLYWAYEKRNAPNSSTDSDLQWDHLTESLWHLNQVQKVAIDLNSNHLFEAVRFGFNSILFNLRFDQLIKLGEYQESFVTREIYSFKTYNALKALENELYSNSVEAYNINFHEIADYIKDQKVFAKHVLAQIEEFVLICQRKKLLDDIITVRELGGLARVISLDYKDNLTVQNEFLTIVEILNKLRIEIKKDKNYTENKNYTEIKLELESLKLCLEKLRDRSITNRTISRITKLLKSF